MAAPQTAPRPVVERRMVHDPDSAVAAWLLMLPDGTVILTINRVAFAEIGAAEAIESWRRLVSARGRSFSVLPLVDVIETGYYLHGHQIAEAEPIAC